MPYVARIFVSLALVARLSAQPAAIPGGESLQLPTARRIADVVAAAQREGWAAQPAGLRVAAVNAYEAGKLPVAEAWLNVARWAALFGENEAQFIPRWIQAVTAAKVGHANMPSRYTPRNGPLGFALSPETQTWLVSDFPLAEEFFALLAPVDYLPRVFQILDELYRHDAARARTYARLAAALAFQRYPDLEAEYVNRAGASLRARGQTSEAEAEERRIARKNQGNRGDLSVGQAREILRRAIATQPLPEQVRAYNSVVDTFGRGAGAIFFDAILVGFVEHLGPQQQPAEARHAIERARHILNPEANSQLDRDFVRLSNTLERTK